MRSCIATHRPPSVVQKTTSQGDFCTTDRRRPRNNARACIFAAVLLLLGACGDGDDAGQGSTGSTNLPASSAPSPTGGPVTTASSGPRLTVPGGSPTSSPATTALTTVDLRPGGPPPWSAGKITSGGARRLGIDEWTIAENKDSARLVLPADVGLSANASPRRANFSGGWAVAWDESSGPGVEPTGAFCETCGRGVAGVAGTAAPASKNFAPPFINVVQWSDGSAVGYTGPRPDDRQFLANLFVTGQGSLYQVWSYLSQRHLEYLISQLRFVEGAP